MKKYIKCDIADNADSKWEVAVDLVNNSRTRRYTLEQIYREFPNDLPISIARHRNTSPELLTELASNPSVSVRNEVASNPSTPLDIIERFSKDDNYYIRQGVANNPNVPYDILLELSDDADWMVRESVAANANDNVPLNILIKLCKDGIRDVRVVARSSLRAISSFAGTSASDLDVIADVDDTAVRRDVAKNPNTSKETLLKLSYGDDIGAEIAMSRLQSMQYNA